MKRVTEALKKASESDVPRFTSGSFIIGTSPAEAEPQSPAVAELESPAEAEPGSQAAAEPESPNAAEPESPAAAEPDSPAEAEPKSPAAAELESPTTVEPESPAVAKQQSSQNQITRSVKIPKKFHGTFIGHKGAHIKQIGQKYGVLLKLNTYKNNISITTTAEPESPAAAEPGSPATAERESPAVAKQQSSQNQITKSVKIPKKFHGAFIGHKGAHIKQIGQKYGVLLGLNTNKNHSPAVAELESPAEAEPESGRNQNQSPQTQRNQGANCVNRLHPTAEPESPAAAEPGSPATAERESPAVAKQQSSQNQITKSVKIPKKFHGAFIGHKGAHIKQIGQKFGVLLGLNTNKNHPKPGLCDHVPLLGDILLARKIEIEMKRVTEALKKASESDVPRFTSGSFIIGTPAGRNHQSGGNRSPAATAEPESPTAAGSQSHQPCRTESPTDAEPRSPAEAERSASRSGTVVTSRSGTRVTSRSGTRVTKRSGTGVTSCSGTRFTSRSGTEITSRSGTGITNHSGTGITSRSETAVQPKSNHEER
ncbi:neurofilament heavy polypeptide-like [Homarus americanus]|uniref:neurofilament heavy polypeptide-like n=1 Tax=Homarus americanus TaxID=6706 RepID=UPI001C438D59|nr:neurofilament heavy polypeptide-like [Homarus americanus]